MTPDAPTIKLTPRQSAEYHRLVYKQPRRYIADGGARSGKTFFMVAALIELAEIYHDNFKWLIVKKTLKSAKSTIFKEPLKKDFLKALKGWTILGTNTSPVITGPRGQEIIIGGLDNPENWRGDEFGGIWINEATQATMDDYAELMTRLNRQCLNDAGEAMQTMCWFDCNPAHRHHWIYQRCILGGVGTGQRREKWKRSTWTPYDNPHRDKYLIETLEALPEVRRRRMLQGEWCDNEGAVYDDFSEDTHTWTWGDEPGNWDDLPTVEGIDFGYIDPFVWLQAKLHDGCLWFFPGYVFASKRICEDHAATIKGHRTRSPRWTVADHDAEDRATLERHGIETEPAYKAIREGVEMVQEWLRPDENGHVRIRIHADMTEIINEFFSYVWLEAKEGRKAKEEPRDFENHSMDVIRYMVMKAAGIEIEKKPEPIRTYGTFGGTMWSNRGR